MNTKQIKSLRKMSTIVGTTSVIVGLSSTTLTSCATTNQFLVDYTNNPEAAGFNKIVLDALDDYINLKINQILYDASNNPVCYGFPSMQIMVTKDAKIIFNKAYGESLRYSQGKQDDSMEGIGEELPNEEKQIATTDTLYDLASVTKMYAGMFSIQHLLYEGKIGSITDPISKYIPSFQKEETIDNVTFNWNQITIKNILTHTAGFPPAPTPLLKGTDDERIRDKEQFLDGIIEHIDSQYIPGTKQIYSDVDYMLVDILVKNITDQYLDEYTSKHIYGPLGLKHTTFKPMEHGFSSSDTAATELVGNTRQRQILPSDNFPDIRVTTIQGEVHDEDSYYCMNGVSGHAGLFSTAHDLTVLSQLMLNGGEFQNIRLFNQDIIDLVSQPIPDPQSETKCQFGVGWKVNADQDTNNFIFGNSAPFQAYGHNGWTGTYSIIDPINNITIVILSNAIHTRLIGDIHPAGNTTLFYGKNKYFLPDGETLAYDYVGKEISEFVYSALK